MSVQGKAELRAWARSLRERQSPDDVLRAGSRIAEILAGSPEFRNVRTVAAYLSLPEEVSTAGVLECCHHEGKRIAVPVWSPSLKRYAWCAWTPETVTAPGPMRVPEPVNQTRVEAEELGLLLVPGLVFDRRGGRLGFGAGHYDRLLGSCRKDAVRVGVAFDWQLVERIPQEPWDERMHAVLTPSGWFSCRGGSDPVDTLPRVPA